MAYSSVRQLDNTSKDNKNKYVFGHFTYLVDSGTFKRLYVSFLPVGHTHEDIGHCFSVVQRALRTKNAYTFDEWKEIIHNVFTGDYNKIYKIEYVWATNDYKQWMNKNRIPTESNYKGYRSTVFHYRFQKNSQKKPAVCQYTKWCYHGDFIEQVPVYQPTEKEVIYSFLDHVLRGSPSLDTSAGTWKEGSRDTGTTTVDVELRLKGIIKVLRMDTNSATQEHVNWWRDFLLVQKPVPGTEVPQYQRWIYRLPDVEGLRTNCKSEYVDVTGLSLLDVSPRRTSLTGF